MTVRRALVVTNMWPDVRRPYSGLFVRQQVDSLRIAAPDWTFDVLVVAVGKGPLGYLRAIPQIRARLRHGYDVVHAHYGLTAAAAAMALATVAGTRVPLVITLHGSDVHISWQRAISRAAAKRARATIAVAPSLAERIQVPAVIAPCGTDTERFRPGESAAARARLGLPRDRPVVLFPADPGNAVKRYSLFASALSAVRSPDFDPVVLTLGQVPPDDVPDHIIASDVVALTSRSEGSPTVVKEALSCGVPVVSVDVGDAAALLAGLPGCHVVSPTPAAIGEAIRRGAADRETGMDTRRQRIFDRGLDARAAARRVLEVLEEATLPSHVRQAP